MVFFDNLTKGIRPYLIIIGIILGMSLFPALNLQPLDRDEARYMQATTQMLETKDFINIRFQDEARNKKPVGIHWMQSISAGLTKDFDTRTPFGFRIISMLGAMLAAISTFLLGSKLFDKRIGFLAAIFLSISVLLSTEAHIAKTDAMLAGFIALSVYGLAKIRFENKTNLIFWFGLSMSILIKGPVGPMVIGLMIALLAILERDIKWAKPILNLKGFALLLLITLPWFIMIGIKTNGQFYIDAIGKDLGEKISGKHENKSQPPGVYILLSPIILWPSCLFLLAGIRAAIKDFADSRIKFLVAIIIPAWLVFEAMPAKLVHYTLPVHFAICILMAYGLMRGHFIKWAKWIGIGLFIIASLAISAIPLIIDEEKLFLNIEILIFLVVFLSSIIALIMVLKNNKFSVLALIASAVLFANLTNAYFLPNFAPLNLSVQISNELIDLKLHPRINNTPVLVGSGYQEPSLIFLTRTDSRLDSAINAVKYAKPNSPVVIEEKEIEKFKSGLKNLEFQDLRQIKGLNYSKGDDVIIHIGILKPKT